MTQRGTAGRMVSNAKNATTVHLVSHQDQGTKERPREKITWVDPWQIKSGSQNDGANQRGSK